MENQRRSSYAFALGDHLHWCLTGSSSTEAWLRWMSRILGFREGADQGSVHVHFVRRPPLLKQLIRRVFMREGPPTEEMSASEIGPKDGWETRDFGSIRIWSHSVVPTIICELAPRKSDARELVMMWNALHALYPGLVQGGGLPLHAGLVSFGGAGVLLAGGEGAGKSTCCSRISGNWRVLADDGALIVPRNGSSYTAHPMPTWSELIMGEGERTCAAESGVPLRAIVFLEKAQEDELVPLGQGHASVMINASATYIAGQGWKKSRPGHDRLIKGLIFDNSCRIAKTVPTFLLRVSASGEFWKKLEWK